MLSTLRVFAFSGLLSACLIAAFAANGASEQLPALPDYVIAISGPSQLSLASPALNVRVAVGNAGFSPAPARVKIKFFWDDKPATTWVRVTQLTTSGSMILPRLSWERDYEFIFEKGELREGKHRFCATVNPDAAIKESNASNNTACFDLTVSNSPLAQSNVNPGPNASPTLQPLTIPSFQPQSPQPPLPSPRTSFGPQCLGGEYVPAGALCSPKPCGEQSTPQCSPPPTCDPKLFGPCAPQPSPSINCLKSPAPEEYEKIKFCYGTIQTRYSPKPEPTPTPTPTPMAKAGPRVIGPDSAQPGETILIGLIVPVTPNAPRTNEFDLCLISEVSFPKLDASSKDACYMSVKYKPEYSLWHSPPPQQTMRFDIRLKLSQYTPRRAYFICPFIPYDFRFQSRRGDATGCAGIKIH